MPTKKSSRWSEEEAYDAGWEDGFGGKPKFTSIPEEFKSFSQGIKFPGQGEYVEGFEHGEAQREKERGGNGNK